MGLTYYLSLLKTPQEPLFEVSWNLITEILDDYQNACGSFPESPAFRVLTYPDSPELRPEGADVGPGCSPRELSPVAEALLSWAKSRPKREDRFGARVALLERLATQLKALTPEDRLISWIL